MWPHSQLPWFTVWAAGLSGTCMWPHSQLSWFTVWAAGLSVLVCGLTHSSHDVLCGPRVSLYLYVASLTALMMYCVGRGALCTCMWPHSQLPWFTVWAAGLSVLVCGLTHSSHDVLCGPRGSLYLYVASLTAPMIYCVGRGALCTCMWPHSQLPWFTVWAAGLSVLVCGLTHSSHDLLCGPRVSLYLYVASLTAPMIYCVGRGSLCTCMWPHSQLPWFTVWAAGLSVLVCGLTHSSHDLLCGPRVSLYLYVASLTAPMIYCVGRGALRYLYVASLTALMIYCVGRGSLCTCMWPHSQLPWFTVWAAGLSVLVCGLTHSSHDLLCGPRVSLYLYVASLTALMIYCVGRGALCTCMWPHSQLSWFTVWAAGLSVLVCGLTHSSHDLLCGPRVSLYLYVASLTAPMIYCVGRGSLCTCMWPHSQLPWFTVWAAGLSVLVCGLTHSSHDLLCGPRVSLYLYVASLTAPMIYCVGLGSLCTCMWPHSQLPWFTVWAAGLSVLVCGLTHSSHDLLCGPRVSLYLYVASLTALMIYCVGRGALCTCMWPHSQLSWFTVWAAGLSVLVCGLTHSSHDLLCGPRVSLYLYVASLTAPMIYCVGRGSLCTCMWPHSQLPWFTVWAAGLSVLVCGLTHSSHDLLCGPRVSLYLYVASLTAPMIYCVGRGALRYLYVASLTAPMIYCVGRGSLCTCMWPHSQLPWFTVWAAGLSVLVCGLTHSSHDLLCGPRGSLYLYVASLTALMIYCVGRGSLCTCMWPHSQLSWFTVWAAGLSVLVCGLTHSSHDLLCGPRGSLYLYVASLTALMIYCVGRGSLCTCMWPHSQLSWFTVWAAGLSVLVCGLTHSSHDLLCGPRGSLYLYVASLTALMIYCVGRGALCTCMWPHSQLLWFTVWAAGLSVLVCGLTHSSYDLLCGPRGSLYLYVASLTALMIYCVGRGSLCTCMWPHSQLSWFTVWAAGLSVLVCGLTHSSHDLLCGPRGSLYLYVASLTAPMIYCVGRGALCTCMWPHSQLPWFTVWAAGLSVLVCGLTHSSHDLLCGPLVSLYLYVASLTAPMIYCVGRWSQPRLIEPPTWPKLV